MTDATLTGEFPANCPKCGYIIRLNGNPYMVCMRGDLSATCRYADGRWTPLDKGACTKIVAHGMKHSK